MEVRAHLRYLRIAPRKVRLVIDLIRGRSLAQAVDQLTILPKGAARPVFKLLQSAAANAEHNFHLDRASLSVKSIVANEGPKLKRYRPRAFGRAAAILKRSSHVTVVLEGKPAASSKAQDKPTTKLATAARPKSGQPAEPAVHLAPAKHPSSPESKTKKRSAEDKVIRRQGQE